MNGKQLKNWNSKEIQREFLLNLASKMNFKNPKDWAKISNLEFRKEGGRTLFAIYGSSIFKVVSSVFPEIPWKREWFRTQNVKYWSSLHNQREFLLNLKTKFNIKDPKDWGKLSYDQFRKEGGSPLLEKYRTIQRTLKTLFSENKWDESWFFSPRPTGYWGVKINQREFLESVSKKLNIKEPKDWGKVTFYDLKEVGARPLVNRFDGKLFNTLVAVFPEIKWNKKWFVYIPKYAPSYWNSTLNQRAFLDMIATKYGVVKSGDWQKITLSLIRKQGGEALLKRYNYSLQFMIKNLYSETTLNKEQSVAQKRAHQYIKRALT